MRVLLIGCALLLAACVHEPPGGMRNMNRATDLKGYAAYSWGLAGVSREHYDDVSIECTARTVLNPVIPQSGMSYIEPGVTLDPGEHFYRSAALEEQARAREERRQRQAIMDACLTEFGFVRFGLTAAQVQVLETLPRGNPERRNYLYGLGSDAAVLARQAL